MQYKIRKAVLDEKELILNIYHSLFGHPGCTWDLEYPSIENIIWDIENKSLYCLYCDNEIIAVASAGKDEELIGLKCWNKDIVNPCELARLGVKKEFHNKGLAEMLIRYIEYDVKNYNFNGIHFLVSKTNPSAMALYKKLNYICCGEASIYQREWFCYEKKL